MSLAVLSWSFRNFGLIHSRLASFTRILSNKQVTLRARSHPRLPGAHSQPGGRTTHLNFDIPDCLSLSDRSSTAVVVSGDIFPFLFKAASLSLLST